MKAIIVCILMVVAAFLFIIIVSLAYLFKKDFDLIASLDEVKKDET